MRLFGVLAGRVRDRQGLASAHHRHRAVRPPPPPLGATQTSGLGAGVGAAYRVRGGARRDPGEAATRGDGRPGGVRAALAGLAQLTRQRRRRGKRAGPVVGAGWGAQGAGPFTCASCSAGARRGRRCERFCRRRRRCRRAARATGAARGLWGEEQWVPPPAPPRTPPRPRAPPPRPARPPSLPPPGLGWGLRGLRSPALGIFQAAEVQLMGLGAPPRPAPPGPSARPTRLRRGPGPTSPQAGVGEGPRKSGL